MNIMIELKEFDNYATIRIMREEKANAMNLDLIDEISAAVDSIEKKRNIISVIITGSGKFFSAVVISVKCLNWMKILVEYSH